MATVRLKRRARLADKLRDVFELPGINEVVAELPCWLFSRSVLLQGFMYLTNAYLCFFAHLPAKEDQVLKSGSLYKKAQRTKRWIKHWFVLKNDVLSWYQSAADPYFPHGVADLRYALSCEPHGEKELRIRTNAKTIHLSADSARQRDDWAKAVRRAMFKSQHEGAHVKVAVPYGLIVDVDKSRAMDWTETVEVKVLEGGVAMDSYFFAYFKDIDGALEQMRDVVRTYRPAVEGGSGSGTAQIMDTTVPRAPASSPQDAPPRPSLDRAGELSPSASTSSSRMSAAFRLSSLWKPISDSLPLVRSPVSAGASLEPQAGERPDEFMHIKKGSSFVPRTAAPRSMTTDPGVHARAHAHAVPGMMGERSVSEGAAGLARSEHTYPPGTLAVEAEPAPSPTWSVGVPSWLRVPGRRAPTSPASAAVVAGSVAGVKEVYATSGGRHRSTGSAGSGAELGYSVLDPGAGVDPEMRDKFRTYFAFDEKETLLGYFPGYIYRVLPVYGRLYVRVKTTPARSFAVLTRYQMILPIRDILSTEPSKAFHFGRYGLVMNLKGYEELFFEFGVEDRRSAFVRLLERQMEDVRSRAQLAGAAGQQDTRDALIFEEYDSRQSSSISSGSDMRGSTDAAVTESLPAHMFTSASSTFLTFKPKESLHFTFLTIGSRGDVQPYIALAKGLMADGHRVRIATHGEFKEWIESHGIEFGYVGGDPAELMRICVENGTFTVSFLKEGLLKFRGWLDDLLKTSWEACQGTDVLIESPSAMAGFHIAEALRIPYFRAFTMTWTRTRAYPHAFAVPERKMGGGYNYMTFVMFDQVFWRAISGQINRWRRKTLGLPSTSLDKMEPHKVPFLYNFSPTIVPPPLDWPEWIRVTGYWFLDSAEVSAQKWTPPAELVQFIDSAHQAGKKVVYIGFGSIVVSDPKGMTRSVIEAIVRSGVYAILSKGWSDRLNAKTGEASEPEEPLPKQIYQINSIPHDWLFQRIDAACHHGGAGTTGASLRAGIPTIIRPFFGDQFFWADRVEALGVGAGVRHLTSESLAQALIAATTDEKQIQRAKVVGERIRAENGVGTAIEAIYRDLEYARSLIKRRADEDVGSDAENATIRESLEALPDPQSPESVASSYGSGPRASSDWSVISGDDGTPSSLTSRRSSYGGDGRLDRPQLPKRNSLAAAVLSVLPSPAAIRPRTPRSTSSPSPSR
ncbi:UDP-Glycosyltransferase/glycogen phosphorylase [Punctularia strigosozonata HHB-11173 SS5]|uniref:UDP-Glycosyltransferase/glycogen phosphorylase n=1 Tax=Punctularia strigosozonata (strain HHB-11173) TaxID=741275 RepID=UPI00044182CF|nr:UDP-Glycosyltransferase/glycogen phosphorylase [Punctularia strigosozonata HHB-11173 SS5]EIN13395.1 UDP-Glycosyltransferase/glycogen phosphorylase [Punctularia strigosozonata HHB-11173 SS5]